MKKFNIRQFLRDYDFKLVFFVIALATVGVFAVGSAKASLQNRQLAGVIAATILMLVISFFDYHFILRYYWFLYILNVILLALVLSNLGDDAGGSQRWLNLGIRFQPSELAKILLILFFAQFIMVNKDKLNRFSTIISSLVLIGLPLLLVYKQPDLSTSIMIAILYCIMMYIGGLNHKIIIGIIAVTIPLLIIFLTLVLQPNQNLIEDYQQVRILAWLHPAEYADTQAYQQTNSKIAIGSGQLLGKGYANSEISSVKNGNFISQPQTDFIFAVIGEEWGFAGGSCVVILIFCISIECFLTAWRARDLAGKIIASGMGGLMCFQSFINIGVTTGLLPNTGLPLPLVSYGLTSLFTTFIGMGIVLNIHLQNGRMSRQPSSKMMFLS